MIKVYLAGGLRSNWQDRVITATNRSSFHFLDPRSHGLADKSQYTLWDLEAIKRCDILFAYFEETNPGGYALAFEIGFAKALGKRIVLVDDKSRTDALVCRYFGMIHEASDTVLESLDKGIQFLKTFEMLAQAEVTP